MKLEKEGSKPDTFIGASSSSSRSSSSRDKDKEKSKTKTADEKGSMPSNATPIKMQSGIMAVPTNDENAMNQFASNNTNRMNPTTTTTTTTSSSPLGNFNNLSDNLNAEIGAVVG